VATEYWIWELPFSWKVYWMTWTEDWESLAARIDGLIRAGEYLTHTLGVANEDPYTVINNAIAPEFKEVTECIEQIGHAYRDELPPAAIKALDRFVSRNWHQYVTKQVGKISRLQPISALAAFRSEFEYLIRDIEIATRNLVDLAFEHLRRQLVVDEEIRGKWQIAFSVHETHCERLGAVHLLSHGIWAFKISSAGAATDLVFPEPVERYTKLSRRIARAQVLTEWKRTQSIDDIDMDAKTARQQTQIYTAGALGDLELKNTRYIVLVIGFDDPGPIDDVVENSVTYRHVLISVKQAPRASEQARSRASGRLRGNRR
jgi:hypothetical protein